VRTGIGWELDAIAAAAIGGVSLMGGIGTVAGTLCGALIIGMMTNAFNLLGINPYWQRIVIGIVLAIAVASYSSGYLRKFAKRLRPLRNGRVSKSRVK
jgi:ribose transport system permease protein